MKRIIGLFSLVLIGFGSLSAYNYQTVYSHRTALFSDINKNLIGMRIDSLSTSGQDSVFYPLKNIQPYDSICFNPYGASWLGPTIIIKQGWNYYFNQNNDTIRIKTDAKLNERWTVYSDPNIIMAVFGTVQKIEAVNFLGVTDTIKTIVFNTVIATSSITAKAKSLISADFDGKTIQISKNYGLIKSFNFNVFPYLNENTKSVMGNWNQYILVGLTNPTLGVQNLTWFDVFDFQPGDEIHSKYFYYIAQAGPETERVKYTILKYLSRQNYNDSIVYSVDATTTDSSFYGNSVTSHAYSSGIYKTTINRNQPFDLLPYESFVRSNYIGKAAMNINSIPCKSLSQVAPYNSIKNCWTNWVNYNDDACNFTGPDKYYKGLGGPYFSSTSGCWSIENSGEENKLVYYKKGSTTWGVPLVISGFNQPKVESNIAVLPNPATDKISINNLTEPCMLELLDLKGSVMLRTTVNASENTLNVSQYDKGLYLYRISANGALLKAGKIVKQ